MELLPLHQFLQGLTDVDGEAWDPEKSVHSYIYEYDIEMPVELEVFVDEAGGVHINSAPPLYYVDTTFRPSYHAIRFTAMKSDSHGRS
jgi:hypothetical protein